MAIKSELLSQDAVIKEYDPMLRPVNVVKSESMSQDYNANYADAKGRLNLFFFN